jgi:hypothetical protein
MDELVRRIPEGVRETLTDLFRARFTSVRRVPAAALKKPAVPEPKLTVP